MQKLLTLKSNLETKILALHEKASKIAELFPVDIGKEDKQLKIRRKKENKTKTNIRFKKR